MNHGDHENTERSAAGCVELATHQPACRRRRARQAHRWSRPPRFAFWGTGPLTKLFSQSSLGSLWFKVLGSEVAASATAVDPSIVVIRQVRKKYFLFLPDMQIFLPESGIKVRVRTADAGK